MTDTTELILNPKTNRYVKKSSQAGKRLLKEMRATPPETLLKTQETKASIPDNLSPPEMPPHLPAIPPQPLQTSIIQAGVDIVENNAAKFKGLTPAQMDELFKKLLLERLSISQAPKKTETKKTEKKTKAKPKSQKNKTKFKLQSPSSSDSDDDSDI